MLPGTSTHYGGRRLNMTKSFESSFAQTLKMFIEQKSALGYKYRNEVYTLLNFDRWCAEHFPAQRTLTKELGLAWAARAQGDVNQLSPVREYGKFLNRIGKNAFVIPAKFGKRAAAPVPYIYSESEIAAIWRAVDSMAPSRSSPLKHMVLPAVFRLLYCCGLRPSEALNLKTDDIDLKVGKIYIRNSKMCRDRILALSDDLLEHLSEYNQRIGLVLPRRASFFPKSSDGCYTVAWLQQEFQKLRQLLALSRHGSNPPRVYDLRHTFATHCLYRWLQEGKELTAMLPYLSAYLGHSNMSDTYYYIHLVPGQLKMMSGLDFSKYEDLLPEVEP